MSNKKFGDPQDVAPISDETITFTTFFMRSNY